MDSTSFKLQFNGKGWEYFGIWLANLALSIITLGIYSPWAKVRRLRYFYQNTTLLGTSFDFHGDAFKILIGRIIAIIFFIAYSILTNLKSYWQFLAFAMVLVFAPFIIQRALRFRFRNTSYRGLRFNFTGTIQGALIDAIVIPFLSALPFGLTYPFGLRQWRRYQLRNGAYGKTNFGFDSGILPFYLMAFFSFIPIILIAVTAVGVVTALGTQAKSAAVPINLPEMAGRITGFMLPVILLLLCVRGIYNYFKHRIIFNGLTLGDYKFKSTIKFWPCIFVFATNDLFSLVTLGLFRPFAAIRASRLQVTNIEITGPTDVGGFIGETTIPVSALGAEAVDFFDFDIGF